ncbi:MAG: helix-turn-helix domain-containing protein [bacterium]|nr:helix-turn-helix domain-containing protein [bacterium]
MSFSQTLQKMGFSDKKSLIYLALLQNGEMSASEIAKETKVQRTTVYDILDDLVKNGFAAIGSAEGKRKTFVAEGPEKLIDFIGDKAEEVARQKKILDEKQEELKELIPQLRGLSDEVVGKPSVHFYDGAKGLVEALNLCLTSKQPLMIYGSLEPWNRWMPDHFQWFSEEATKRHMEIRRIDQKTINKLRGEDVEIDGGWPIRLLPVGFTLPGFVLVYGDNVLKASFQRPMATIIQDKELAGSQKTIFELFWQFLRETS